MMISRLKNLVKNNPLIYRAYRIVGSTVLKGVGLFVKPDPNLVLFVSYGGRKFDDSPRVVYEYLLKHPVSEKHRLVWAFSNPDDYPQVNNRIKIDTPAYYFTALKAGTWITNTSVARGMDFKKRNTKNIMFTHGMVGTKRIGSDVLDHSQVFVSEATEKFDAVFVEGKEEAPILARVWNLEESVFLPMGLPRNDDLVSVDAQEIGRLRQEIGIPDGKKVILYAPTFRDYKKDSNGSCVQPIPMDFEKWERLLGEEYVLVIRAHYTVARLLGDLPGSSFVLDRSAWPKLNDLLKVSDVLISDYSSIVFDYAILNRPVFCYGYDLETYLECRGTYLDLQELFSQGVIRTEDALIRAIQTMDYPEECKFTREQLKEKHLASYGNAAEKAVEVIFGSRREPN